MSLLELFNRAALTDKSIVPFCKEMARALDDLDQRIEARRAVEPLVPTLRQPTEPTFYQRMERTNGYGDVLNCIRDMAVAIDLLREWMGAVETKAPVKRGPGRPRKDAA
jgi:hypothetical protein